MVDEGRLKRRRIECCSLSIEVVLIPPRMFNLTVVEAHVVGKSVEAAVDTVAMLTARSQVPPDWRPSYRRLCVPFASPPLPGEICC